MDAINSVTRRLLLLVKTATRVSSKLSFAMVRILTLRINKVALAYITASPTASTH